jgi:hypothetical protein
MKRYKYKTIELKLKGLGIFGPKRADDFEHVLNKEGSRGWRYIDTLIESDVNGHPTHLNLIFEQEEEAESVVSVT